ncbi:hypothetical protein B0H14DRAFT_2647192 [Mycena olivaceomarginata]|nr:hypothetical protein B0H14DRAFT_2647192 [Mycena olivaceomarginata]
MSDVSKLSHQSEKHYGGSKLIYLDLSQNLGIAANVTDPRLSRLKTGFRGGGLHIASNCRVCSEKDRLRKQEKRNGKDPEKENALTGVSKDDPDDASEFLGVDPISLDTFRGVLRAAGEINVLCARVDISALPNAGTDGLKAATDVLAEIIWETIGYRFLEFL